MQVRVSPLKAYLSRQMDVLDDNDPFVVLKLGSQTQRTATKANENIPTWDEEFVFKCEGDTMLEVKVMDQDQFVNEEIGNCRVDLKPFLKSHQNIEQYFPLKFSSTPAGKILIRVQFEGAPNFVNTKSARSNEMKWYTPSQETALQYAMYLQNLQILGAKNYRQGNQLHQTVNPNQSPYQVHQPFPQQQCFINLPVSLSQTQYRNQSSYTHQSLRPQRTTQYQPQVVRAQSYYIPSKQPYSQKYLLPLSLSSPQVGDTLPNNQIGFVRTNQDRWLKPVAHQQQFSQGPLFVRYG